MLRSSASAIIVMALVAACLARAHLPGASGVRAAGNVAVTTQHNDAARTGANLQETTLNTANVNVGSFGMLFTRPVDGSLYAQPLYVPNLTIPGKGTHNVVFAATMHNTVYAFDADDPAQSAPLWSTNLGPSIPLPNPCIGGTDYNDIAAEVGILSTPVVDVSTDTLYVVAATQEASGTPNCNGYLFSHRLHALNLFTGQELAGSPVTISAGVPGTGAGNSGGVDTFTSYRELQRAGLLLANGNLYIGFASYEDTPPYWGWILRYDAQPGTANFLRQDAVFNVAPDGWDGGIWDSGQGLTADANGNIYMVTGNGKWDAGTGGSSYGDSVVKLNPSLQVVDWFTPYNQSTLDQEDIDLGSTGVLLLPGTSRLINGGKQGKIYLLDQNNLGHFQSGSDSQIPQSLQASVGHIHGSPIYWNGPNGPTIYVWGEWDYLHAYRYANGQFNTSPASSSSMPAAPGMPGGMLSLSANGSAPGSGIVWASLPTEDANPQVAPGILRAFDASDLSHELWDSQQDQARDDVGNFAKFAPPTVANGKVYLGTFSNRLDVYGLLGSGSPTPTGSATPVPPPASATGTAVPPTGTPAATGTSTGSTGSFTTSFEGTDPQPSWTDTGDSGVYPAGGIVNVTGICCGPSGPETGVRQEIARTGVAALMYSGNDTSAAASYAYLKVFDLSGQPLKVGSGTTLSYWIYPQSSATSPVGVSGSNSSCVAIDLIFSDGTNLRDSGAVDQNGNRLHPAAQCGHLAMDSWNHVTSNIGAVAAGKSIIRIDVGYDQPANTGGYRGYLDDLSIGSTSTPGSTATPTNTVGASFATGFEGTDPQPSWIDTGDSGLYPAGGIVNVTGICCGLAGPETGVRNETAHTGSGALMYSGNDTSTAASYAYDKVFDLSGQPLKVGSGTTLSYWIYPQSGATSPAAVSGSNSSCVAIDLIFSDGTNLRDSGAVDQNGNRLHPAAQCGHLALDTWDHVTANIGAVAAGKSIVRIDVGYDQPANTGGYRGYIDDLSIQ